MKLFKSILKFIGSVLEGFMATSGIDSYADAVTPNHFPDAKKMVAKPKFAKRIHIRAQELQNRWTRWASFCG